jgi:hypothetical protein
MGRVRLRLQRGGERLWRLEDFRDLPFAAVAQALSRLARAGVVQRMSKGVYYHSRETAFGKSRPNPMDIRQLARGHRAMFSSGMAAANLLGLSAQTAQRAELATTAGSLPRKLIGEATVVHGRRPATWMSLSDIDVAILDFLRHGGEFNDLPQDEMLRRLLTLLSEDRRFERLMKIADAEPPRVRAMLGALGERLGRPARELQKLKALLNPFSRFDFGVLSHLPNARDWQAKQKQP